MLDLAAGTGTSSLTFTATGADCVACDFSLGMLQRPRPAGRAEGAEGAGTAPQEQGGSGGIVPPGN